MKKNTKSIRALLTASLMMLSVIAFQGCNTNSNQSRTEEAVVQSSDSIDADMQDAADRTAVNFEEERDEAVANLEQQRDKLDQNIDELQTKLDRKSDKARETMKRQLDKLKTERQDLDRDIDKAKNATQDAWQEIKVGFKKAGRTLGDSFDKAGERLDGAN